MKSEQGISTKLAFSFMVTTVAMKICSNKECKETNPLFSPGRAKCRKCRDIDRRKNRDLKREEWNAYMRQYNKEHIHSKAYKRRHKNKWLRLRYGISLEIYETMHASQNGLCAICGKEPKSNRSLVVDHHHLTKKVRELLCDGCNVAIAILDNEEFLRKGLAYITKHK